MSEDILNELSDLNKTGKLLLPRVSVVTVVFNGEKSLERCIKSVISQSYRNFEYILIDGNSTDQTVDIIRKHGKEIFYWISEPDRGVYDAMNKALKVATGEWIYFLGSDDIFVSRDILNKIFLNRDISTFQILYGNVLYDNQYLYKSKYSNALLIKNTLHHQGTFYRSSLFKCFSYDPNFSVFADYDLNLLSYLQKKSAFYLGATIAICSSGGVSGKPILKNYVQEIYIRQKYMSRYKSFLFDVCTILRWGIKLIIVSISKFPPSLKEQS